LNVLLLSTVGFLLFSFLCQFSNHMCYVVRHLD
jgi:hypothetical protein